MLLLITRINQGLLIVAYDLNNFLWTPKDFWNIYFCKVYWIKSEICLFLFSIELSFSREMWQNFLLPVSKFKHIKRFYWWCCSIERKQYRKKRRKKMRKIYRTSFWQPFRKYKIILSLLKRYLNLIDFFLFIYLLLIILVYDVAVDHRCHYLCWSENQTSVEWCH